MEYFTVSKYKELVRGIVEELPVRKGSILVTGATGMIGSCLVDSLIEANRNGACFEIYALGRSMARLESRFPGIEVKCIEGDIVSFTDFQPSVDYVIHAASNADPVTYARFPAETILTNVIGAKNILDYATRNKARVLLTSTFEVYGKIDFDVYRETDYGVLDQNSMRSGYPESKRTAELMFRAYHEEFGTDSVIVRLPSVYGPTMLQNDSKAHAQFLRKAIRNENIVLKSEGLQRRTYCSVFDAVRAIFYVLFHGISCEAYNISNMDSVISIAGLAELIAGLASVTVEFCLPDDIEKKGFSKPQNCILDNRKIRDLGWQPKFGIEEGVSDTLSILKELDDGVSEM